MRALYATLASFQHTLTLVKYSVNNAMKIYFFILCLVSTMTQKVLAQKNIYASNHKQEKKAKYINDFPDFDHSLLLEAKSDTTANVSFGDLDGDGHLDILLVKGRHLAHCRPHCSW